jgi:tetratricopeptide (TPR) repeat protein
MKLIVTLPLALVSVLATRSCFNLVTKNGSSSSSRDPELPATSGAAWVARISPDKSLTHSYAELPPTVEWPVILNRLRQPGQDTAVLKLRLLGDILADDHAAASVAIHALLLKQPDRMKSYARGEALKYLYTFSKDTAAASQWVAQALPPENPKIPSEPNDDEKISKLLAENKIPEAVTQLRALIDAKQSPADKLDDLGKLTRIARLLDMHPLYEDTLAESKTIALSISTVDFYGGYQFSSLFDELTQLKDWQSIRQIATRYRKGAGSDDFYPESLIATYHLEGPAGYLAELRRSPDFGITDSKAFLSLLVGTSFRQRNNLGEITIRSYMKAGEKENARVTLAHLLTLNMGDDTLYRLAIEYFPNEAGAMFEAVRPVNNYQERPLIWLAELALQKNDLPLAQQLIDQAITLDPSDGEQGKETRMQAYDVLSRLFRAQGNTEKAGFFNEVVKSIRNGEVADDFLQAGLIQEAIRRYQEALGHFADAYCLQSRLAKTLLKAGKVEEAMVHFEKAFELMPVSFGPVESHCFGCERIFEDGRVQQVALKTFNRIIESTPKNPRTYYLLGLLLEEMKQPEAAILAMRKSMELDPKYYNCAKHLLTLLSKNPTTLAEAQNVIKELVVIAPYAELREIYRQRTDLRQTWIDAQSIPPFPLKLDPLPLPFQIDKAKAVNRYHYLSDSIMALDGWTTQDLLDKNALVSWIEGF